MKKKHASLPVRLVALLVLATGLAACAGPQEGALNALSEQEQSEGWQLLFTGDDFSGWRGYRQQTTPAGWVIDDGAIHFSGEEGGGDLITAEQYEDFVLELDWKIGPCGNSGIMYRVTEDNERPYHSGPEYQVLDNTCHPDAKNGLDRTAGANYALNEPVKDVTKPAGEWNSTRIVVNDGTVQHWLNGEKVVEYELGGADWQQRVAASKFNEWAPYGKAPRGHIVLQDHSDPVWYRNIKIKPL